MNERKNHQELKMENEAFESILKSKSVEPNIRELLMYKAEQEFKSGNEWESVYYQIRVLWSIFEERYFRISRKTNILDNFDSIGKGMNAWEKGHLRNSPLMQYAVKIIPNKDQTDVFPKECNLVEWDFLRNAKIPTLALQKVVDICTEMPKEWTILQICKGFCPETSFSIYPKIHQSEAPVYLTVFKHIRSNQYPKPICMRLEDSAHGNLFRKYGTIVDQFKECIVVDNKDCESSEARAKYWEQLKAFDKTLQQALIDLKNFVYPWNFLFRGKPKNMTANIKIFREIDKFCDKWKIRERERVLISLFAISLEEMQEKTIQDFCMQLGRSREESQSMFTLLHELYLSALLKVDKEETFPCILITDEYLDHIFWEELNIHQEFTRVSSLQCLWRLFQCHREKIKNGYFVTHISEGVCLLNPDNNLPKTEMRMKSFFKYWASHWTLHAGVKPSQDQFFQNFFKCSCYVYAGHGSGLQYVNGRHIAKHRIDSVIFLFGCDSSRLHSNGLYSELIGAHLYYHAAMCPTLIGTLMPGLDARMDCVAAEILSRWITPQTMEVVPWSDIDIIKWTKEGKIQRKKSENSDTDSITLVVNKDYQIASLCSIIARIHQRITEQKFYNTVPYICRGLPAWNSNVKDISF